MTAESQKVLLLCFNPRVNNYDAAISSLLALLCRSIHETIIFIEMKSPPPQFPINSSENSSKYSWSLEIGTMARGRE